MKDRGKTLEEKCDEEKEIIQELSDTFELSFLLGYFVGRIWKKFLESGLYNK